MISASRKPRSVAIENVVFVEFRTPTRCSDTRLGGRAEMLENSAYAAAPYTQTIIGMGDIATAARELPMLGADQTSGGEDLAAALLLGPGSGDWFPAPHRV